MINNQLYTGVDAIAAQIADLYPGLELSKTKVMEWSAYVQMHELVLIKEWFLFDNVQLDIDQKKALLPCNVHKLLDVWSTTYGRVKFRNDGVYLYFNEPFTDVYIKYRGFPVTEEGEPLFIKGTEKALARYCIRNAFEQDFITGKLDGQRWSYIMGEWEMERDQARSRVATLNRNDIEKLLQINADMIPKLGFIPTYTLD